MPKGLFCREDAVLGLTGKRIALERNGEIVPRSSFAAQQLADGDKLEIVVAMGERFDGAKGKTLEKRLYRIKP